MLPPPPPPGDAMFGAAHRDAPPNVVIALPLHKAAHIAHQEHSHGMAIPLVSVRGCVFMGGPSRHSAFRIGSVALSVQGIAVVSRVPMFCIQWLPLHASMPPVLFQFLAYPSCA